MKFGIHFGARGTAGEPDSLKAIAQKAEALGFGHFGISDHVIVATNVDSAYPYSETGRFFAQDTGVSLETLTTLSFVAASTTSIRLLPSVLVLPHRQPVLAAKMLATVDKLSKGRLTVGVGIGWMQEEIALLGGPAFADRARASEETLEGFRALWTRSAPEYEGKHVRFKNLLFAPKPDQPGVQGMPIWVGGEVKGALRRAGRFGDGWYPVSANPRIPLDTPERYRPALTEVRNAADEAGRDADAIEAGLLAIKTRIGEPQTGPDGTRMPFTGSAQAIVDDIGAMADAGLEHFFIGGDGHDLAGTLAMMEQFQADVMAKLT